MIDLRGIHVSFRDRVVLSGIDLAIRAGERVALIGPNGAGKSTLLRVVTGLVSPSRGEVSIGGDPLASLDRAAIARRIAVVPQQVVVPFSTRLEELVALGRLPHEDPLRGARPADRAAVASAIERVGIGHLLGRDVRELSLGERQLALVALAVAQAAPVLILDEPTVHLDLRHQVATMELLVDLNVRDGTTVVAVLHDLGLAAHFFPRLVLLDGGRIVADGEPREVLSARRIARRLRRRAGHGPPAGSGRMIASWRTALALLTRLPAGSSADDRPGARWFGLVGGRGGCGGLVPMVALGPSMPAAAAILAVGTMAILSGALHLDGLADTADALVAIGPGAAERARKDPSIGVGGATALVLVLGLDIVSLATLAGTSGAIAAGLACLAGGALSRAVPVVVARIARSRAARVGLGGGFAQQLTAADMVVASSTALAVAGVAALAAASWPVLIGSLVAFPVGVGLGLAIVRARHQLDGDGLGAAVELSVAAMLLATAWAAAAGRLPAA